MTLPSIPGHSIIKRLGTGGFASVYLAENDISGEQFAIKVLHAHSKNESDLRRFDRERMTMQAFSGHPHIVSVFDSGETEGAEHYMVLEYIGGGSVRDLLRERGALHWSETLRIAVQICSALDVAHRSGVLHRDVKPGNVLLDNDDAKLTDFGIARLVGQSQVTAAQSIIGTLAYTPPEVFHDRGFDGRGDIYQLGITMYEMLLGRAPFTSAAADNKAMIIRRILDKPAPSLAPFDIPQQISDLLDEILSKDPADRPQSAEGLGQRLNEIERELGRTPTPMYRNDPNGGSPDVETTDHPGGIETIHAPTMPIDMNAEMGSNPTIDASTVGDSVWPAAAGTGAAAAAAAGATAGTDPAGGLTPPTPPVVTPPDDANMTVAEPRHEEATSIIGQSRPEPEPASKPVEAAASAKAAPAQPQTRPQQSRPEQTATSQPKPAAAPPHDEERKSRAPWLLLLFGLIIVGGAGALFALNGLGDDDAATDDGVDEAEPTEPTEAPTVPTRIPEFAPVAGDVFSQPAGSDGVVFDSVANSQGLTMVGSAGDGERVSDQRSVVWTFGANDFAVQRDLDESGAHRMWAIGVIDSETFLAVGDTPGVDGIAWTGDQTASLIEVPDDEFAGPAQDQLRASVEDPTADSTFLVGGSRSVGSTAVTALWEVSGEPSWDEPTWTPIDLGNDEGVINDIAVDGDIAAAVGMETIDGQDAGFILIRRGDTWSDLIQPQPNVQFWGVTISDGQIFAVGERDTNSTPTPIAVISNAEGVGDIHVLPIRSGEGGVETGLARDVMTLSDGTVITVGDVGRRVDPEDPESTLDRDGAVWQYLPEDDVWTTRASSDLIADGFTELWNINEWDDTVYVFGRTETEDGRQPAGAWTLALDE